MHDDHDEISGVNPPARRQLPHTKAWASIAFGLGVSAVLAVLLFSAIGNAREAARRNSANCLMKQLGLAMHNYHDEYKSFPPQAIVDAKGRPLLSWRVLILPYMEQSELYKQFRLDEPWDSPHNKKLMARIPGSYQGPKSAGGMKTNYVLAVGKGAAYTGSDAVTENQIPDGTSQTFMIVEADNDHAVFWTQPKDLTYNPAKPVNGLGQLWDGGFHVAIWDGSVRFIPVDTDPNELRAGFDPADGRGMSIDSY